MRMLLFAATWLCIFSTNAQVKIGDTGTPDDNAVLELASTNKGLLLPRLELVKTNDPSPLNAHIAGMVVYNTATSSDVVPGYYFNDGSQWISFSQTNTAWNRTGNAETNPVVHFIGTTDAQDFVFKSNSLERLRILSTGGIQIGTSFLPGDIRMKFGGTLTGNNAAVIGIDPAITATANGDALFGIRNRPVFFNGGFNPATVIGSISELSYGGSASAQLIGSAGQVSTNAGDYPGSNSAVYGYMSRNSGGAADGDFFGGHFRAYIQSTGAGAANRLLAVNAEVGNLGTGANTLTQLGGIYNTVSMNNLNGTVNSMFGTRNSLNVSNGSVQETYGVLNQTSILRPVAFHAGFYDFLSVTGTGSITEAFGIYLSNAAPAVSNYRGIFIGNINLPSGIRRAIEYNGLGSNDPFVVNHDGSVGIGTISPPVNVKLSVVDGHFQSGQGIRPTVTTFPSIGTSGAAAVADATDVAGFVNIDFGTGAWGSGAIVTVNYNRAYATPPIVSLTAANLEAAIAMRDLGVYITTATTGFTVNFATAPATGTIRSFTYHVIETINN